MEERKLFVCKFCNKRYTCGKSLGGHIRTHMTQHSSTGTVKFDGDRNNNTDDAARKKRKKRDLGSDYGLRENPRKTSRFVHSNPSFVHHEKFCKECGKGFPSLKALCGHMACHSEKEKQKLAMMDDTQSDTETCVPKGSKRMRFMALNSHNNLTSSSVSELEQEEEEEVAMCLMLLSKDLSSQRGRLALLTESNSENNSVVLEAKSPSVDTIIAANSGKNKIKNSVCNIASSQHVDKKKVRNDDDMMKFKFSDSGYFRYGSNKVDSGVSIDGVLKNDVFKRKKVGDRHGFEDHDVSESRKKMMNNRFCRSRNTESKKSVLKKLDYSEFDSSRKRVNHDYLSRKNKKNGFPCHENYKNGSNDSESYQKSTESTDSDSDTDSDSYPSSSSSSQKQESKAKKKLNPNQRRDHECPICNKTFRSGQALGGHKRSHFVGGFEENNNTVIIKQDSHNFPSPSPSPPSPAVPCLIDLNLPAPVD